MLFLDAVIPSIFHILWLDVRLVLQDFFLNWKETKWAFFSKVIAIVDAGCYLLV